MVDTNGDVNHIQIPVKDLGKAKEFYGAVFDWKVDTESMPNYGLVERGKGKVTIGLFVAEEIAPSAVSIVMMVDDIEATLKKAKAAGGDTVREKYEIAPGIGHSAVFKDCFGNSIDVFSPP